MSDSENILYRKWSIDRRRQSVWRQISPPQLFVISFALLIGLGVLALKWIPGLYTDREMGWLDALFTATSAVCITGLSVADISADFTRRGQLVLLVLVQIGGLGILTFTSLIIVALGRRMSLRHEALSGAGGEAAPHVKKHNLVRSIFRFTFAIEAIGAVLLFALWVPSLGWREAAWHGVFHSINAFCNAGFSTFENSLSGFQRSPFTLTVVMGLIIVGGLGFLTLEELHLRQKARALQQNFRVSVHTRIVLASTAVLILMGWVLFTAFEWKYELRELPAWARVLNGLFMSVTPRSGGFNTIDYSDATAGTNFLTILLMSIGGSPGSLAGGLKTTTAAVIVLLAWSRLRGRITINLVGRSVPDETVQRAVGLFVITFTGVTASIFVLTATELWGEHSEAFLLLMFEAVSTFSTSGLSMGQTPYLSDGGKLTLVLLMFFGRVGPLTLAAALARPRKMTGGEFRYAYEDVVVG